MSESRESEPWVRKALAEGAIAGVVAPLVVVLIVTAMSGHLQSMFREPTCDDPKDLTLLTPDTADAHSTLTDEDWTYFASNAMDTNTGTAWVEDADGYGVGEWIEFAFPEAVDVQLICVVNGYAQSAKLYRLNGRVRQFDVTTDQGTKTAVLADLPLGQIATFQRLALPQGETMTVRLTIGATSSSGGSQAITDTAISEVEFWGYQRGAPATRRPPPSPATGTAGR